MKGKSKKEILKETVINGSRVYVEDGDVKVELNEEIQKQGWMDANEFFDLLIDEIRKIYALRRNEIQNI